MKTWLLIACALGVSSAAAACGDRLRADAPAQSSAQAQTRTVTGQVVCLVCYARNKANTGPDHDDGRMCAQACIKWEGNPAGVLTADGKVYQLTGGVVANNNARVLPFIARKVSVTGEVYEKDGMTMIRAEEVRPAQ